MFNGDVSGSYNVNGCMASSNNSFFEWLANGEFDNASSVRIVYATYSAPNPAITVNGINANANSNSRANAEVTIALPSGLQSIRGYTTATRDQYTNIKGVYVDGVMLLDYTATSITAINEAPPSITVDKGTWAVGQVVKAPATTPATGTVASVDFGSTNSISLATSDETFPKRWIVNQDKFVKGPASPSADAAPNTKGLELFSSAFASTPEGAIGQTGASWQVAAYEDINFTSPVAQELESTTDLTQWPVVPELAVNTKYRCRVRHISLEQSSEWSDASTFKTLEPYANPTAEPGAIIRINDNGTYSPISPVPVKFINCGNYGGNTTFGIDTAGNVWTSQNDAGMGFNTDYSNKNLIDMVSGYGASTNILGLNAEGIVYWGSASNQPLNFVPQALVDSDGVSCTGKRIHKLANLNSVLLVECETANGEQRFFGSGGKFGNVVLPDSLTEVKFFDNYNSGKFITSVCGVFGNVSSELAVLTIETGQIYAFGTLSSSAYTGSVPSGGTIANPKLMTSANTPGLSDAILSSVAKVGNCQGSYFDGYSWSLLTKSGQLYGETGGSRGQSIGPNAFSQSASSLQLLSEDCADVAIGASSYSRYYVLKTNGTIITGRGSLPTSDIVGLGTLKKIGSMSGSVNGYNAGPYIIIP
jgi:hypothetical protein